MAKIPNYTDAFIFNSVFCDNCKIVATPQGGVVIRLTRDEVIATAEQQHASAISQEKILCVNSRLVIGFAPTIVTSALLNQIEPTKDNG